MKIMKQYAGIMTMTLIKGNNFTYSSKCDFKHNGRFDEKEIRKARKKGKRKKK